MTLTLNTACTVTAYDLQPFSFSFWSLSFLIFIIVLMVPYEELLWEFNKIIFRAQTFPNTKYVLNKCEPFPKTCVSGAGELHDKCAIFPGVGISIIFTTQIYANILIIVKATLYYTASSVIPSSTKWDLIFPELYYISLGIFPKEM